MSGISAVFGLFTNVPELPRGGADIAFYVCATREMTGASQIYLLELNGNGAGGPTHGTYTSSTCATGDTATPIALQGAQTAP